MGGSGAVGGGPEGVTDLIGLAGMVTRSKGEITIVVEEVVKTHPDRIKPVIKKPFGAQPQPVMHIRGLEGLVDDVVVHLDAGVRDVLVGGSQNEGPRNGLLYRVVEPHFRVGILDGQGERSNGSFGPPKVIGQAQIQSQPLAAFQNTPGFGGQGQVFQVQAKEKIPGGIQWKGDGTDVGSAGTGSAGKIGKLGKGENRPILEGIETRRVPLEII